MKKAILAVTAALFLVFGLTGCNSSTEPKEEAVQEEAVETAVVEESKTVSVESLFLAYPASWTLEEDEGGGAAVRLGDPFVVVTILPPRDLVENASDELAWIAAFGGAKSGLEGEGLVFSDEPIEFSAKGAGHTELYSYDNEYNQNLLKGYLLGATYDGKFYGVIAIMDMDGYSQYDETVLGIIKSISFS